ncbi:penicillin-insensitive murein endopeptidase [Vibrio azureus]|uniref:Penicillin-insensitive murein endopeptidase n=1 Tax=Vibrio azureus NBRC 104587 TaxID=1219077 RepID=U3A962_9VIBR|nr:penicillin-insensitive murein endopeptidase [Vibrio azureus]AUI85368.1 penicillin-insensitive murein endopeptidase [Vibrio azureus]GAD76476.1 penicillin-insensitive murein endopeptidase [Vibrio azureus NBRC 104587]
MNLRVLVWLSVLFSSSAFATSWEQASEPTINSSASIGSYANGCLDGAQALPLQGVGYQVLRSQTRRYYGHPNAITFLQKLGKKAQQDLDTHLLIGDMSLARGGRFSSGHSSHQTGLDIDIWLRLADVPLSDNELKIPKPLSVVDLKNYRILDKNWDPRHFELIRYTASQDDVARIFVHPVIKQQLCTQESSSNRDWLRKIRPWWGHHYHFHIRLKCPASSSNCIEQSPPPSGDGCGKELESWQPKFALAPSKNNKKASPKPKPKKLPPEQCLKIMPIE